MNEPLFSPKNDGFTRHPVIVLTGGVASGKSTVAEFWQQWGARIIDTDALSRELTRQGGAAMPLIEKAFGADYVIQGALHREAMRALVFAELQARQRLEAIIHPLIRTAQTQLISQPTTAPITVVQIPLFAETGARRVLSEGLIPPIVAHSVVVVDVSPTLQLARMKARRGLEESLASAILKTQATRHERWDIADWRIENDGNLAKLEQISRYVFHRLLPH